MTDPRISEVITWWRDATENWFSQAPAFDAIVRARFAHLHDAGTTGDPSPWQTTPEGCLALLILLD